MRRFPISCISQSTLLQQKKQGNVNGLTVIAVAAVAAAAVVLPVVTAINQKQRLVSTTISKLFYILMMH